MLLSEQVKLGSYCVFIHKKFVEDGLARFPIKDADILQEGNVLAIVPREGLNVFLHVQYRPSKLVKIFTPYEKLFLFNIDGADCFLLSTKERKIRYITNQFGWKVWEEKV